MLCEAVRKFILSLFGVEGLIFFLYALCDCVRILVLIFFALHLTHLPSFLYIHHHFIHKQLQLRPVPNLASRTYLCTVS